MFIVSYEKMFGVIVLTIIVIIVLLPSVLYKMFRTESLPTNTINGKQFNDMYPNGKFYKLFNATETHNGYLYRDGLNVLIEDFNPKGMCSKGGFYFFRGSEWKHVCVNSMTFTIEYIRRVTVPDDALVYIEGHKFKCDRLILGERHLVINHPWFFEKSLIDLLNDYNLDIVSIRNFIFRYLPESMITYKICLTGVKRWAQIIRDIPETYRNNKKLWMFAVTDRPDLITCVPKPVCSFDIYRAAVNSDSKMLRHVPSPYYERLKLLLESPDYVKPKRYK